VTSTTVAPVDSDRKHALTGVEVALYVRVSTVEQAEEGVSLDAQEAELRRLAEQRWPDSVIVVHREEGKSAREGKLRPVYEALLDRASSGRVRAIVSVERSRLARSVTEWLALRKLCADQTIHLETLNGGVEDTSTATGRLIGTILAAVAEFESDLKSERVARAANYLLGTGRSHGPVPFGLRRAPDGTRERAEHFDAVLATFQLIADGASVKKAARALAEARATKTSEPWLRERVLRNPTYAGLTKRDGQLTQTHEAFVPADLWHRVQTVLDANASKNSRHPRRNPFGSLARCGRCGGRMELHQNGNYPVVRCEHRRSRTCDAATIPTENFEIAVLSALSRAYCALRYWLDDPTWTWQLTDPDAQRDRLDKLADTTIQIADVEGRADRLYFAFEEGAMEQDAYLARAKELRERRSALEATRSDLARDGHDHRADLQELVTTLGGPHGDDLLPGLRPFALWRDSTFEERVELLRASIRTITVEHDAYVSVGFRAGPVLTYAVATRRNALSADYRRSGYGLWGKDPRAPP